MFNIKEMNISAIMDLVYILLFALIWLLIASFLRSKKNKNFRYLLFFTLFYVYIYKVLDYTLFQFQSLILLKHFMPNLMLRGQEADKALNLIPLVTLGTADIKTSLLNILLFVPFGFGLPFITNLSGKKVVVYGMLFSVCIELLQYLTGAVAGITFRVADINDVIFNTLGTLMGLSFYRLFVYIYRSFVLRR